MLNFTQVDKSFSVNAIFHNLNIEFKKSRYCISGENGSGKTTLLLLAAGLEAADAGKITIDGKCVTSPVSKNKLGISSDKIQLPEFLTAQQLINFHCQQFHVANATPFIDGLTFATQLAQQVSDLSLGNQKKLSLILALSHQPEVLLLDEPTTGLDSKSRHWLLNYINNFYGQVIVTSHEAVFLEHPDFIHLAIDELRHN